MSQKHIVNIQARLRKWNKSVHKADYIPIRKTDESLEIQDKIGREWLERFK